MRVGQKNKLTYRWAMKGSRPRAAHDQRTQSTYLFVARVVTARGPGLFEPVLPLGVDEPPAVFDEFAPSVSLSGSSVSGNARG